MGAAKVRKLSLVAQAASGEPVTIELGDKTARRLAALLYASQGAKVVAEGAIAAHKALHDRWQEAIAGVLEAHGVEAAGEVQHDPDAGVITITPAAVEE